MNADDKGKDPGAIVFEDSRINLSFFHMYVAHFGLFPGWRNKSNFAVAAAPHCCVNMVPIVTKNKSLKRY